MNKTSTYMVTGGAGFIGSHVVDRLVQQPNSEIIVLDNLKRGRLSNIEHLLDYSQVQFLQQDVRDYAALLEAMEGVDVVFHLAAQSNVMGALEDVDYAFESNVVGTFNVLKAAAERQVKKVVFTSSREVYGEAQFLPVTEDHPISSKNTYGASKVSGETYCQVFSHNFGLNVAVVRLANVYGPRDIGRVIPLWLERALRGEDIIVFGGEQLIDFIWIDYVVEALIKIAQPEFRDSRPINIGSGRGTSILTLAERVLTLVQSESKLDLQPARRVEVVKFVADVSQMQQKLYIQPPQDPLAFLPHLLPQTAAV